MRKIVKTMLAMVMACILLPHIVLPVQAAEEKEKFIFELSVDGKDTKEVELGDVITVVLRLKRTDANEEYTMHAMQDEIRYDSTFFEVVEGSAVLSDGIASTDIAMVDEYREFYMNYLSMSGGEQWKPDTLIGSLQLKVIGESGVTKITNEDYLVSFKDGTGSYPCEANELTIVLSTECTVSFKSNGGNEIAEQIVQFGEKINRPDDPVREGYKFEGWYTDIHLNDAWDFESDTVQGNTSLYAKWSSGSENKDSAKATDENSSNDGELNSNTVFDSAQTDDNSYIVVWGLIAISLISILLLILLFKWKKADK